MKLEQYLHLYQGNKENAFVGAAENSEVDILEDLLLLGVDINSKDSRFGASALHRAASNGSKMVVEFLLAKGADINALDGNELTPLMNACLRGKKKGSEIALLLVRKNAEVKYVRQSDGMTAYKFALWGQCTEDLLIELRSADAALPEQEFRVVHIV